MPSTSPIRTPAMVTGDPAFRSPTLSNSAVRRYPAVVPPSLSPFAGSCVVRKNNAANPSSTNRPVPISRVRVGRMIDLCLQEGGGQHVVEKQREHGGSHHGAGRGEPHAFGGGLGRVTGVNRDQAARHP